MDKTKSGAHPERDVLAMAYVNRQEWREIYKCDCGFARGTIFAELDKPWSGNAGKRGGYCK